MAANNVIIVLKIINFDKKAIPYVALARIKYQDKKKTPRKAMKR